MNTNPQESGNAGGFVSTSETTFVSFSISRDVLFVPQPELLDGLLNHLVAPIFPHRLSATTIKYIR